MRLCLVHMSPGGNVRVKSVEMFRVSSVMWKLQEENCHGFSTNDRRWIHSSSRMTLESTEELQGPGLVRGLSRWNHKSEVRRRARVAAEGPEAVGRGARASIYLERMSYVAASLLPRPPS